MTRYIVIITVSATILRLISLFQTPLSYDESFDILLSRNPDFITRSKAIIEGHPPFYFFLFNLWQSLSNNIHYVRLLSLVFGVLTIPLIAIVGKKLFNRRVGELVALLTAISPSQIFYSSIARSYSLTILESLIIVYFLCYF